MDQRTLARFMGKVTVRVNGCWHMPPTHKDGYAMFSIGRKYFQAHRVSYEHFVGPIPEGLVLDHRCHTDDPACRGGLGCLHRRCVNPKHLEPVTAEVNTLRGRGTSARNAAKQLCSRGHEFTPDNTYRDPRGGRECRTCRAAASKAWVEAHHPGLRHGTETHCPSNHPYEGDNLIITVTGGRACRECKRAGNREYMRNKRAAAKSA
jgi:hypothetical protein